MYTVTLMPLKKAIIDGLVGSEESREPGSVDCNRPVLRHKVPADFLVAEQTKANCVGETHAPYHLSIFSFTLCVHHHLTVPPAIELDSSKPHFSGIRFCPVRVP